MENQFEGVFELFDVKVRRLGGSGNRLRLIFERQENIEIEKELIELRGKNVAVEITQEPAPEEKEQVINLSGTFELFELKCRRLRQDEKLRFELECPYEKEFEMQAVGLRFEDCRIFMKAIDTELKFDDEEELKL